MAEKEIKIIKDKYNDLIIKSSGKVHKIEEWGLLNLANKIKNYKNFFIHYKFEGNKKIHLMKLKVKLKWTAQLLDF